MSLGQLPTYLIIPTGPFQGHQINQSREYKRNFFPSRTCFAYNKSFVWQTEFTFRNVWHGLNAFKRILAYKWNLFHHAYVLQIINHTVLTYRNVCHGLNFRFYLIRRENAVFFSIPLGQKKSNPVNLRYNRLKADILTRGKPKIQQPCTVYMYIEPVKPLREAWK